MHDFDGGFIKRSKYFAPAFLTKASPFNTIQSGGARTLITYLRRVANQRGTARVDGIDVI
jgi:hypothetical protein